ncbi:dehydrogenase E1 component subunit alpha/beta [bacterium]|nr:dehydrogenase E1 component subunit alpha/beta [bacterium]
MTKRTAKKVAPKKKVSTKKRTAKTTAAKKTAGKKTSAKTRSSRTPSRKKLAKEMLIHSYHEMFRSRAVDEKIIVLYKQNKCHFQIGCAGHEAVQVATAQAFRPGRDWFYPYYRDMALCATLGMPNADFMLNALNKDDDPNSHGRQMPMHWGSKELRIVNQSSPTGTQFLQAVGCALAIRKLGLEEVVYVSAGEGTCSQGDFHEALNWAAREKLPVVFLIQNNKYAISVPVSEQLAGESVFKIAHGYENLELHSIDGTDLEESFHTAAAAHSRALRGDGPSLIEAHVPRLQSHSISDNHLKYRTDEDLEAERAQDPNAILRHRLLKQKLLSEDELTELEQRIRREIDEAAEFAETQPDPDPAQVESHTYSEEPRDPFASDQTEQEPERRKTGSEEDEVYLVDALNHALDEELSRDESVYLFGQDVAHGKGGVFTVTSGLTEKHGRERVFNGPLAESSIVGVGVGMATLGLKPVVEIQFGDYIWTAMMQIRNEVAMLRYRSKGDFSCPLVIRVPVGGYIHGAAYHSQNIEATFAHFPGLRIVHPSNATDAKGLLKSAIRSDDPVLFLEHKGLYRQVYAKGAEGGADALTPIGKAAIAREGSDLTIVTYGALVQKALLTAEHLEKEDGVSVEVIDLRTIAPLDTETIFASVRKTNRVLIAHEDVVFMGFGAEVTSQIATHCFEHLDAPPHRVGMKSVAAVPHAPSSESVVLPQTDDLVVASRRVLQF